MRKRNVLKYETNTFIRITEKISWKGPSLKERATLKLHQVAHFKYKSKYILAR